MKNYVIYEGKNVKFRFDDFLTAFTVLHNLRNSNCHFTYTMAILPMNYEETNNL